MKTRKDLLQRIPKGSICTELGVFDGAFSAQILEIVCPSVLWLVDLFEGPHQSCDENGLNSRNIMLEDAYKTLQNKYKGQEDSVFFYKGKTENFFNIAANQNYFDFIYIDADHSYQAVQQDLKNALNAIKQGGYICGHDYYGPDFVGTVKAVNEFSADHNLGFELTTDDLYPSFLFHVTNKK